MIALNTARCAHAANEQGSPSSAPLERLRLALPASIRAAPAGRTIALEGEATGEVIGVIAGLVRCFRLTTDGRRHVCRFAGPGALLALAPFGAPPHAVEAVTDSQICTFRASTVGSAFERDANIRAAIIDAIAAELAEHERIQLRLSCLTADQRVADFLLELSAGAAGRVIDIPMSRLDIADHLGVTLETVSRALHRFQRLGLIRLGAHCVEILRRGELSRLIEGEEDCVDLRPRRRSRSMA